RLGHRLIGMTVMPWIGVDLGAIAEGTEGEVRLDPDDRIAPAHRPAFHRFEQEAIPAPGGNLEHRGNRRFQIGDETGPYDLRLAGIVGARKIADSGFDQHGGAGLPAGQSTVLDRPSACCNATWLS